MQKFKIVTIFILFVLIFGTVFSFSPSSDFRRDISNAIHAAQPSQTYTTRVSELHPCEIYSVSDIKLDETISPSSIFFLRGELSKEDFPNLEFGQANETGYSFIKLNSQHELRVNALVVCQQNAEELTNALDIVSDNSILVNDPTTPISYCKEVQPCCAVILLKNQRAEDTNSVGTNFCPNGFNSYSSFNSESASLIMSNLFSNPTSALLMITILVLVPVLLFIFKKDLFKVFVLTLVAGIPGTIYSVVLLGLTGILIILPVLTNFNLFNLFTGIFLLVVSSTSSGVPSFITIISLLVFISKKHPEIKISQLMLLACFHLVILLILLLSTLLVTY